MVSGSLERGDGGNYPKGSELSRRKFIPVAAIAAASLAGAGVFIGRNMGGNSKEMAVAGDDEQEPITVEEIEESMIVQNRPAEEDVAIQEEAVAEAPLSSEARLAFDDLRRTERSDLHSGHRSPYEMDDIFNDKENGGPEGLTEALYTQKADILTDDGEVDTVMASELFVERFGDGLRTFCVADGLEGPLNISSETAFVASGSFLDKHIAKGAGGYINDSVDDVEDGVLCELFSGAHKSVLSRYYHAAEAGDLNYSLGVELLVSKDDHQHSEDFKAEENRYLRNLTLKFTDNFGDITGALSQNLDVVGVLPVIIDTNHHEIVRFEPLVSPTTVTPLHEVARQRP